ncbi:hypothetical protein GGR54DRAFT_257069 [Hypoxylon sp. NC1633]|nr:hypothetical protein GGR54DRAFT_257069 [Hypoxylon sp. NC1633]
MANSGAPQMPRAASSNMAMSMSTVSASPEKLRDRALDSSAPKQDTAETIGMGSSSLKFKHSKHLTTLRTSSTSGQLLADARRDEPSSRERAYNRQRIQLAEQLSTERKTRTDLEDRIATLQNELAGLKSRNDALEAECAGLQAQIDEAVKERASQTTEAEQRDKATQEKVSDLESKLEEAAKNLEKSILDRDQLQKAHDEVVKVRDQQADVIKELETELEMARLQTCDLKDKYEKLQENVHKSVESIIAGMEKSHKSRESDLQQRLDCHVTETEELRQQIKTLRIACADAASKRVAAEMEDEARALEYRAEAFEERLNMAAEHEDSRKEWDAELQKVKQRLEELQRSIKPFPQLVVICVDVSGSLASFIHEIKQAYRDVLHMVKSKNNEAKVAVVVHGTRERQDPSPPQIISDATFQIVDSVNIIRDTEDYTYCLEKATTFFEMDARSKKLVVLIGDGVAFRSNTTALQASCEKLKSTNIAAHSIVLTTVGDMRYCPEMKDISVATGGRVETKDTYMSALDEILRHEREKYFMSHTLEN